jgi:hypothetical protein
MSIQSGPTPIVLKQKLIPSGSDNNRAQNYCFYFYCANYLIKKALMFVEINYMHQIRN